MNELIRYINRRLAFWGCVHIVCGLGALSFVWFISFSVVLFYGGYVHAFTYAHILTGVLLVFGLLIHLRQWRQQWGLYKNPFTNHYTVGTYYGYNDTGNDFLFSHFVLAGTEHIYRGVDKILRRLYLNDEEKRLAAAVIYQLQQRGTKPRFHPLGDLDKRMVQKLINAEIIWTKPGTDDDQYLIGLNRAYDQARLI